MALSLFVMARTSRAMTMREQRPGQTFLSLPVILVAMGINPTCIRYSRRYTYRVC
jgi:hypothetical protein